MTTIPAVVKPSVIFILTLGILSMLPALGVDMYLPAFLRISQDLHIDAEEVQHTLTFFAYGLAIGQLFWGPVRDSYGRKPVVLVGALMRDLFSKNDFSRIMSTITLVFMLAPLVAPIIGGYLVAYFHWHSIFYVIATMGFLSALLVFFIIPETHKKENRIPLRLNVVVRNFVSLGKKKEVLGYMFMSAFGFGGMFAFLTAGSIIYIGIYGVSEQHFGYFFMLNIGVMTLGSFLNGRMVSKLGTEKMLQIGLGIQFVAALWLLVVYFADLGLMPMAIGVALFVGQNPLISSNAMASILEKFPAMAGTANSMVGSVRFGAGASKFNGRERTLWGWSLYWFASGINEN